jgi:ABC-type spermidine/putrescine transport system permease subunit I
MTQKTISKFLVLSPPSIFLTMFLIVPLINIFVYSFWGIDPQTGMMRPGLNLDNYITFFSKYMYLQSFIRTIEVTSVVVCVCLIFAYPSAYYLAYSVSKKWQPFLLFLIILPSWSSLLIRTFSWMVVLRPNGFFDSYLKMLNLYDQPLSILYTKTAAIIGLIHIYLPFMILPIYSCLKNMDKNLILAARTLGATSTRAFLRITLPLSSAGIITGVFLVTLPVFGAFITPKLLGGTRDIMLGNVIEMQFKDLYNWPFGAAISSIFAIVILITLYFFDKVVGLDKILNNH